MNSVLKSLSEGALASRVRINRFAAAGIHLFFSAAVAVLAAVLIFRIWYPAPFERMAGGANLFLLLVMVDVVLGPALTFVVASPGKPRAEFLRDLGVIVFLQLAAFGYGLYTVALARPVYESFEIDRFRIVTAVDLEPEELAKALPELRSLPWRGPVLIAAVKPADPAEQLKSIELGLAGFDLSMIPSNWRPYASERERAWNAARPATLLAARHPEFAGELARLAADGGRSVDDLRFLPVLSRQVSWVAILAPPDAQVIGHLPADGLFR